jgi:hypothetical protein
MQTPAHVQMEQRFDQFHSCSVAVRHPPYPAFFFFFLFEVAAIHPAVAQIFKSDAAFTAAFSVATEQVRFARRFPLPSRPCRTPRLIPIYRTIALLYINVEN